MLRYAWNHTCPENRSAFTYWEEDIPPRIDLGKLKYGGPFTTEEVEDTKTFFRIILIFFSLLEIQQISHSSRHSYKHAQINGTRITVLSDHRSYSNHYLRQEKPFKLTDNIPLVSCYIITSNIDNNPSSSLLDEYRDSCDLNNTPFLFLMITNILHELHVAVFMTILSSSSVLRLLFD